MFKKFLLVTGLVSLGVFTYFSLKETKNKPPSIEDLFSAQKRKRILKDRMAVYLNEKALTALENGEESKYLKENTYDRYYYTWLVSPRDTTVFPEGYLPGSKENHLKLVRQYPERDFNSIEIVEDNHGLLPTDEFEFDDDKEQGRLLHRLTKSVSVIRDNPAKPLIVNNSLIQKEAEQFAREQLKRERPKEYEVLYYENQRRPASQGDR